MPVHLMSGPPSEVVELGKWTNWYKHADNPHLMERLMIRGRWIHWHMAPIDEPNPDGNHMHSKAIRNPDAKSYRDEDVPVCGVRIDGYSYKTRKAFVERMRKISKSPLRYTFWMRVKDGLRWVDPALAIRRGKIRRANYREECNQQKEKERLDQIVSKTTVKGETSGPLARIVASLPIYTESELRAYVANHSSQSYDSFESAKIAFRSRDLQETLRNFCRMARLRGWDSPELRGKNLTVYEDWGTHSSGYTDLLRLSNGEFVIVSRRSDSS